MSVRYGPVEQDAQEWIVAATIATEVPPYPHGAFTAEMIPVSLRAVAEVIRNRASSPHFPDTAVEVVLQPRQFSAVCRDAYWTQAIAGKWCDTHVDNALDAWRYAVGEPAYDIAQGATHYFSPCSMKPVGSVPAWIQNMTEINIPSIDTTFFRWFR